MRGRGFFVCFAAAALVLPLAACEHTPGDIGASSAPPPVPTAVGPLPGPAQNPTRRPNPYANNVSAMAEGRELFVRMN